MEFSDTAEQQLFLNALQTYADSCTQPALTPNCPYFRLDAEGRATCGEECHTVLELHGVSGRPITTAAVGGLIMTGRALPRAVVAGSEDFDATRLFLHERGTPPNERSTASLLIETLVQIGSAITQAPSGGNDAFDLWAELVRRGIDMDRVFAGGMAEEWVAALAGHDLESAFRPSVPEAHLFMSFPGRAAQDPKGQWIWERFTLTDTSDWELSSLVLEWHWTSGTADPICDATTLNERTVPIERVMSGAMQALNQRHPRRDPDDLFKPGNYVARAAAYLADGAWEKAMKIFEGIVALSPGDGEAWNNLGFCQLGESASKALPLLRRGAALQNPVASISIANQMLAMHLLGQDSEALALAGVALDGGLHDGEMAAMVWLHPTDEGELELGDADNVESYLRGLREHILTAECFAREAPA